MKAIIPFFILIVACSPQSHENNSSLIDQMAGLEGLEGKQEYLSSPFVAAGDRAYVVGHQDGSFPDLGWHVKDEMGGIWAHPIKLLDGYSLNISDDSGLDWCLTNANTFTNYPVGSVHEFSKDGLEVKRFQFVPDGLEGVVVEYVISNTSAEARRLNLTFTGMIDLMPVWLSERLGWEDGVDSFEWVEGRVVASDPNNPWFVVIGSDVNAKMVDRSGCMKTRNGNGVDASILSSIEIAVKNAEVVRYFIAGSSESQEKAIETFKTLKTQASTLLENKVERMQIIARSNELKLPDAGLSQMFRWIKYNTDWLVQEVPNQGRGVTAGIPDYPWWFGTDGAYILQGLSSAGMHEEALSTIDLIIKLSRETNGESGKIMHEASTNGVVFNPGNLNTTPTFIHALWKVYAWTGDKRILDYYEDVKKGIVWIESQDKDGNGYPDGAGMMEIHGLHSEMIDVVAYQYQAFLAAAKFAEVKDHLTLAKEYEAKAILLKAKINSDWWVEDFNSYADFRATKDETIELIEAAIVRADTIRKPWSSEELTQTLGKVRAIKDKQLNGYVVHHNWVVNTPMEVGAADAEKALIALKTAENYRSRFGMFVTGIDRDESQEKAEKWEVFSYVGAVMTLPTGVQAIGEAKYGNPDKALEYLKMLENSFGYALPGSMYEVSPDFGMVAQGWNIYAVAVPIVDHFFGIQPMAYDQEILISPNLPSTWPSGSLENVKVGDNEISISFERVGETIQYEIEQTKDWTIHFRIGDETTSSNDRKQSFKR